MNTPKNDYEALVLALNLSITADNDEKADVCVGMAEEIAARMPVEQVEKAKIESAPLDLLDKIYANPSDIDRVCKDYNALRQDEQYADIEEEIEEAIANIDIDLIWEAVGPDAYDQHYAVGMQVRALIAEENWAELGRIIGEGAKAYLRPFAADKVEGTRND
jgi:hypothetical protein